MLCTLNLYNRVIFWQQKMNPISQEETMKKLIIMALLTSGTWAADFSNEGKGMLQEGVNNQPTFDQFDLNNDGKLPQKN